MITFSIRKGDRLPEVTSVLGVDLTGATVRFHMALQGVTAKVDALATVVDALTGSVKYAWATADTDTAGDFMGEWEVTFPDGRKQSFPRGGYLRIRISRELA